MSQSSNAGSEQSAVTSAIDAFRRGDPVCVHDAADREGETDLIYPAAAVTPSAVSRLRNDAGGLICVALGHDVAERFGLPFLQDVLDHPVADDHDLSYDERSSFSLPVNHRDTDTGITDNDRALTIRELAAAATAPEETDFESTFRSPGHVNVLRGAPNRLADRRGHTELGLALAQAAERSPAVVVCEMLDDDTGEALAPADAATYAEAHGIPFVEGRQLIERFV
ncbi:3,4-dihydroxy-2-butanone 4-phosphate synthase [Halovenus aranensis]|uniref:3,4-dihydroxy-2-butanone 4-phosphate synthase n=1 Tax=Halovenus aranensis TaxID=890420 RepID=A0A1G8UTU2_9EURY|nr:3,4-dihydroxy-2-butanone-4-phosphate synthase [Halovenus aranensis]SDJ57296.1 3,4-dihydroxy-2-butanone 4-phosphate synthase [Halovenus aranensis]